MKREGMAKHFILAFLLALAGYAFFYQTIEHRRTRKGPWQVTFARNAAGDPAIIIAQPKLAITNVQISFTVEPLPDTNASSAVASDHARPESPITNHLPPITTLFFAQPLPVPYDVPFGKCVFMDTTFLPGTVTFDLFGHEIELLPRALIIDRQEHSWQSGASITLPRAPSAPVPAKPLTRNRSKATVLSHHASRITFHASHPTVVAAGSLNRSSTSRGGP
jgi:hypothetical protein